MRTIRLDLAYEGTNYHGFGIQPNGPTIQEVLEETLATIVGDRPRVTAAGRTDAGVHASGQVVSFRTTSRLCPTALMRAANARLPDDIQVEWAAEMPPEFDARRSALRRRYRYTVCNRRRRDFWQRRWSWHIGHSLDVLAMQAASDLLLGRRSFAAFLGQSAREPAKRSTVRTVEHATWRTERGILLFDITADGFLRHMVRGIVGTLVWVGRGRLDAAGFGEIVASGDRRQAGQNAPPAGLMLVGVEYPERFTQEDAEHDEDVCTQGRGDHPDLACDRRLQ
jgi:tRNA pseudouridine38-40 synthase